MYKYTKHFCNICGIFGICFHFRTKDCEIFEPIKDSKELYYSKYESNIKLPELSFQLMETPSIAWYNLFICPKKNHLQCKQSVVAESFQMINPIKLFKFERECIYYFMKYGVDNSCFIFSILKGFIFFNISYFLIYISEIFL